MIQDKIFSEPAWKGKKQNKTVLYGTSNYIDETLTKEVVINWRRVRWRPARISRTNANGNDKYVSQPLKQCIKASLKKSEENLNFPTGGQCTDQDK